MRRSRKLLYAGVTLLIIAGVQWFKGSSPIPTIFGAGLVLWTYFNSDD